MMSLKKTVDAIVRKLDEMKIADIKIYYLGNKSPLADYFILSTADNVIQLDTVRMKLDDFMHEKGKRLKNPQEEWQGGWLLMDYGDIIVHVFLEEKRSFYNLDGLLEAGNIDLNEIRHVAGR